MSVNLIAHRLMVLVVMAVPALASAEGLLQLYDAAVASNPAFRGREFGVEQAKAQKDLARSRLLPQIKVDGSYDWNQFDQGDLATDYYNGTRGVVSARQPLFDLPSYHRLKGAQLAVEQSEFERTAAEMELATEVVDRYLTVLQADDKLVYLKSEKAAIESQLKQLRFMRERKLAKVTDLYEVEAYYQGLLTREIEVHNAQAIARERLRETTGVPATGVEPLVRDALPAAPGDEEQWVREAVSRNPNLLALGKASEAASRLVESGRAEYLPRLSLSASQIYADQGYDNRQVPEYEVGTVGVVLSMPIYEGGRVQASVRDATAKYRMSLEQYEAMRREIERSVRSAYLNAVASYARMGSTAEETRALEKVVEAQKKSYEYRITTVLDVLIAQRRLTKARSDESKARYDYVRDLTVLKAHIGEPMRPHIEEIDGWMATDR